MLLQEVTVAGLDKPMRLTTLSASVCAVGLNVREAHVFSTKNGFLLDIFVTDPLPGVDAEELEDVRNIPHIFPLIRIRNSFVTDSN
jgi:UTP:GlnB (protein PII) uridylyltransferase